MSEESVTCQFLLEVERDKLDTEGGERESERGFTVIFLNTVISFKMEDVAAIHALPGQVVLKERVRIRHQTLVRPLRTCVRRIPAEVIGVFVLNLDSEKIQICTKDDRQNKSLHIR